MHISSLLISIAIITFGKCINYEAPNFSVFFTLPLSSSSPNTLLLNRPENVAHMGGQKCMDSWWNNLMERD